VLLSSERLAGLLAHLDRSRADAIQCEGALMDGKSIKVSTKRSWISSISLFMTVSTHRGLGRVKYAPTVAQHVDRYTASGTRTAANGLVHTLH